jgi:hypothetical protein
VTHANPVIHAIHVILVNPVIRAMEHVKRVKYVIVVNVLVILVKHVIIHVKRATRVEYIEVMKIE